MENCFTFYVYAVYADGLPERSDWCQYWRDSVWRGESQNALQTYARSLMTARGVHQIAQACCGHTQDRWSPYKKRLESRILQAKPETLPLKGPST